MLRILSYNEMTNESVKSVLKTFARYEPNHESAPFSISDAKGVTTRLINATAASNDLKYHVNSKKR